MKFLEELGNLAFATRLKLLSETLASDVADIYREEGIDFEPKFFAIVFLLKQRGTSNVTVIADEIGISQPAVSQLIDSMQKKGLIEISADKKDTRKKVISLSKKARRMLPALERVWHNLNLVHEDIYNEAGVNILDVLSRLERVLDGRSLYKRLQEKLKRDELDCVAIIDYRPSLKRYFKSLNREWLENYFTIEEADKEMLNDPEKAIIRKGGFIQFARYGKEIIGTCAMLKVDALSYELCKMAVDKKYRGMGIGHKIAGSVLLKANELGARKIILHTNPGLINAVSLYTRLGFEKKDELKPAVKYKRQTFMMELDLKKYFEKIKYQ